MSSMISRLDLLAGDGVSAGLLGLLLRRESGMHMFGGHIFGQLNN